MDYNKDKVDEMVLALLSLGLFHEGPTWRVWKGFDWDALDRLHEKGYISNPKSPARSVVMSDEGAKRAQELFDQYFRSITTELSKGKPDRS